LKTILKDLFPFYLENRFYFYLNLEEMFFTILISFGEIIYRYYFYFLGTLSRDNILILILKKLLKSLSYFILEKYFYRFRKGYFFSTLLI